MESDALESMFLEDFGQKVDLTRRIREVLLNYPEGTTVLKELIQNADDAGATCVRLCLDSRVHGSDSLLSGSLAQWQGTALLAYNNAIFREEDFVSISRIGGSNKYGQMWKTGRFGVGFNSVYHLTDLPSFVSGKYVVLFDPQGAYLPNVSVSNPGKRIDYVSSSAISVYRDQFHPYCAFGCDMKMPFDGTLFRFPLRNAEQAITSKLSRQSYTASDIHTMFDQLFTEGIFSLLFLKNVLSIEMYVLDAEEMEPRKLYSCAVNSTNDNIIWHRQMPLRMSKSVMPIDHEMDAYLVDFLRESTSEPRFTRNDTFYIVQTMASASSRIGSFAVTASKDYDIHLRPWASVAACISGGSFENNPLKLGQAFCFLPLPLRTGLTVQVNGYFEVSSNRRGIWYGADMDRSGRIRSMWNKLLLEDIVAPAFARLLLGVQELLGPTDAYYSLWPSGSFEKPWDILVEHIYKNIFHSHVLYSNIGGGKWISPSEAFHHDEGFAKSKELSDALLQIGIPIVSLPSYLFDMFLKCATSFQLKVMTPAAVRQFLREMSLVNLSKPCKLVLFEYCLDDLIDADVGVYTANLALLPLANGDFGLLSEAGKGMSYFICNDLEYMLLEQISERVVDRNIPDNVFYRLSSVALLSNANLVVFNVHHLPDFFPRFMPADWKYKIKVLWKPESCYAHPSKSWLSLFWRYLQYQRENVSLFYDWPILPSTSGHLYRPLQSKLINIAELSDMLQFILVKIGCKVLDINYGVECCNLSILVYEPNIAGVLQAIFDVASSNEAITQTLDTLSDEETDELRRFLLDPKWYMGDFFDSSNVKSCMRLPIYKVYGGESTKEFFSDLVNPKKYLPPFDVPKYLLGFEFIANLSDSEEEILLKYYDIERMGKAQFYRKHVLDEINKFHPDVRDRVMLSILQNLPQLSIEDSSIKEYLRNLEFVSTSSGALKCPIVLYDPRIQELLDLLEDSDSFPCGPFQESGILDMLQSLGLRTSTTRETIIESARQVERLMHDDQAKANSKGKVLLSYLEVNAMKWLPNQLNVDEGDRVISRAASKFKPHHLRYDLEKFWSDLRMICWCPVLDTTPFQALPWPITSSKVAPPKLVRLKADLWLVSASMRILDGECSSTTLSYNLGWLSPPGGSAIAAQLLELGKNNELVTDQVVRQELALSMPKIYSILTHMIGSDEMEIVKAILEGCRWIWVGDGFAMVDEVVLDGPLHLAPYLRVIPIDLAVFKDLFLELGIREALNPFDYANILCRMASRKGSSPLDALEIRATILIAQHLSEVQCHKQVTIYLPDTSGRLYPATDLVYNDAPWLLGFDEVDTLFGGSSTARLSAKWTSQKFIHGNISNKVAEKIGVRSLRRILLAESADSLNFSLAEACEAFGQHEALTTRLRHILDMYADGPGILFEMVQNAEDAGASEVVFLLDKTQYGTSSILSPQMAKWQGPALYCFNDSVFSHQDLYAISCIGQESKVEKPFAVGRFGLGFNCVYHFTDVPAFVSGENIVIFDPHACNLPGISPSDPGLRIKFIGRKILEQFPDQFTPFLQFGCDLCDYFSGTLFRFPLRTASLASQSQIKKEVYAPEDVMSLFSSFFASVSDALLFLRNVKSISVFVKEGIGQEMKALHRVERDSVSEPTSNARHQIFGVMDVNEHTTISRDQLLNKLSNITDKDLPYRCQRIMVKEENMSGVVSHTWLTSECLSNGRSRVNSSFSSNKFLRSVPWACVAAHLTSVEITEDVSDVLNNTSSGSSNTSEISVASTEDAKTFGGRAFCFLPLPINTGLPVHVNAYFELSSNRRDIWFGSDMVGGGKERSDWNLYLIENVVAPAYGRLLEKIAMEIGPCDQFFSFWPTLETLEPWSSLIRKLYSFVTDCDLRVLYTKARGGKWVSPKQAILPDFAFGKAQDMCEALSDAGLPFVNIPKPVVDCFIDVCPSLHFLTPRLLRSLLVRRKRQFKDQKAMILILEYCLLDLKMPVQQDNLYGLPLLPLADGSFTTFEKNGYGERIFLARGDEYGLLKDLLPQQLVHNQLPETIISKLCNLAQNDQSNVSFLYCHLLEKLLMILLPSEWLLAKEVSWYPGHLGQPTLEWVKLLWSYLNSHCDDLSIFSKWPILPVEDNSLLQLTKSSHVIKHEGWSENMSSLLLKVGCRFLTCNMLIEHPQLKQYVHSPTAVGILNAFLAVVGGKENIEGLFSDASEEELHELRNFLLQSKWFLEDYMDDLHIEIIKFIPMFESYRSRKLVSLGKLTKWLKPDGIREELVTDSFIRVESERERIIVRKYLGIGEPSKLEFYKAHVLNHMADFLSEQGAVEAILDDVKRLSEEDVSIKSALSSTPFVLAADGSWQKSSRLYDPRVPELQKMLHREAFFPSEKFSDPKALDTLVTLGLRTTLGYNGFVDCARTISIMHNSGDPQAPVYGSKLLVYLDFIALKLSSGGEKHLTEMGNDHFIKNSEVAEDDDKFTNPSMDKNILSQGDLDISHIIGNLVSDVPEENFWSEIKEIPWCPICASPPIEGLPWLESSARVGSPTVVRPQSQMWMVSSMWHILDGQCCLELQHQLGWMYQPSIGTLSNQLVQLSSSYNQLKLCSVNESVFTDAMQTGISSLYSKLQEYIGTDDFMELKAALEGVPWVWVGDDFVSPNALAFDSPVKFTPYLYVVPSELIGFRNLLLELGVRISFGISDYLHVLQRLQSEVKGMSLSTDQLDFVHCVLVAISELVIDKCLFEASDSGLLMPDSTGILMASRQLLYNDAPWIESSDLAGKHIVHPSVDNVLANRLGVKSLRCMSLVSENMAKDLPCMDFTRISDLLSVYGNNEALLYDLLELADCCKARKLHLVFDKRQHPSQSLLQHNFGEFQGPALVAILEGATFSREEVSSLQLVPPWRLRGSTLTYGLGLLSCYFICDVLSIVSGGFFYIFDPCGLALGKPSSGAPAAKVFSLTGTDLMERFPDQFRPLMIGQNVSCRSLDSVVIRMPLSSRCSKDGLDLGLQKVQQITDMFLEHSSRMLVFLKSILQVSISTWEEGSSQLCQEYSVSLDSQASILRNPFLEKKWNKFQITRLFGSSNAAIKMHVIEVHVFEKGRNFLDRWLVVLSLGSGQTRNMALDRRYSAYNLTPVAGVAAHISRNGIASNVCSTSAILCPLPLSSVVTFPVTVVGYFLACHNGGRFLFKYQNKEDVVEVQPDIGDQLIEAWNRALMACVRDSYIEMMVEMQKLRVDPSTSILESNVSYGVVSSLKAFGDKTYSFWPRSGGNEHNGCGNTTSTKMSDADWQCIIEEVIRPFYSRVVDLPIWQLFSGNLVKANEGMFLSQPDNMVDDNLLPVTVCSFLKEHYQVFSVPWDLVNEIHAVGVTVQEIEPRMVRDLLRLSSKSIILQSADTYLDVLEYSLSDIQFPGSSESHGNDTTVEPIATNAFGRTSNDMNCTYSSTLLPNRQGQSSTQSSSGSGDALEMVTSLGKALFDFGRGVVEDIGRVGTLTPTGITISGSNGRNGIVDQRILSIAAEIRRLPCLTATNHLEPLGVSELWLGNREQQSLMLPLASKFVHAKVLDRPILAEIFSRNAIQSLLKLRSFSIEMIATHMRLFFHETWVNQVTESSVPPWFSWGNSPGSIGGLGPSPEWIRLFWKCFSRSSADVSLFSDWPLIPAFLGKPILCRIREKEVIFMPPALDDISSGDSAVCMNIKRYESQPTNQYDLALEVGKNRHPWLLSLLNQCHIPIFDTNFIECAVSCNIFPAHGQSLGQVIASKLVAAKTAGYCPELTSFSDSDRDGILNFFSYDFSSNGSVYCTEQLEVLHSLPIFRNVSGSYTQLNSQENCLIASNSFLKLEDESFLSYSSGSVECSFLFALGVPVLDDRQILVRFGLPKFEEKPLPEREDILIYLYANWPDLQGDCSIIEALREAKFVRGADGSSKIYRPKDLFDPEDSLLVSAFNGERKKFPGERFATDRWLRILRKVGLQNTTDADVILQCAERVQLLGNENMRLTGGHDTNVTQFQGEVSKEIWALAKSVIEAVLSNFAIFYRNNFCNVLGKIACVPAEIGFPNVGGKKSGKRVLTSYSEAILLKDWPLAWSCSPVLSSQNITPPEYAWGALHLRSPPAFATLLQHLKNIGKNGGEDTLAYWPNASGMMTIDEASCAVLKYLAKIWESLSSSDKAKLEGVAFLPAANGTRLVTTNSLFVHLTINLAPFAFELPPVYHPFLTMLTDLGLQYSLSVASAKKLLLKLQKRCGYRHLNPNELRAAMEILNFICDGHSDLNSTNGYVWGSESIVPDDGCRLVHARLCVYIDSHGSRYVEHINTQKLRFVHPYLPKRISMGLGIKKLSDAVTEELDDTEDLEYLECIGNVPLAVVQVKLLSRSLQHAIWYLFNSIPSCSPANNIMNLEKIQNLLEYVAKRLQFVKCLHTRFWLLPDLVDITSTSKMSIIPEWKDEAQHRTLYYVNQSKECILVAEPPTYISVLDIVSIVISQVLECPIVLPFGSLFSCPSGAELATLNILKLNHEEIEFGLASNKLIGREIMPQDIAQVQLHPLRPFYRGEIVAWRNQIGERLKYGRVPEDVRPSAGQALYRFQVETELRRTQPLLSSQVYSFRCVSEETEASSPIPIQDLCALNDDQRDMNTLEFSERGKTNSQANANCIQYEQVSAAEVVQAVNEMLSAAGINLDIEKKVLMQKTITLEEQLKESQEALLLEQEKADTSAKEADLAKAAWLCRICLSNEVDMTVVPCGHVLCRRCVSEVSRCPFCRLQVTRTIKIFRP